MSSHGHHPPVFHPQAVGNIPAGPIDIHSFGPYGPEVEAMTGLVEEQVGPSETPAHGIVKSAVLTVGDYIDRMQRRGKGYDAAGLDVFLREKAATLTDESLPILAQLSVDVRFGYEDALEVIEDDPHGQSAETQQDYFGLVLTGNAIQALAHVGLREIDQGVAAGDGVYDDFVRIEEELYQEELERREIERRAQEIAESDHSQRFVFNDPSLAIRIADRVWSELDQMSPNARKRRVAAFKALGGIAAVAVFGDLVVADVGNIEQHLGQIGEGVAALGAVGAASYILKSPTRPVRVAVNRRIDQLEEGLRYDYGEGAGKYEFHESMEDFVARIWDNDEIQGMADQARDLLVEHLNTDEVRLLPPSRGGSVNDYVSLMLSAARDEMAPLDLHNAEDDSDPLSEAGYVMAIIRRMASKKTPEQLYAYITEGYTPPPEPTPPATPDSGDGGGTDPDGGAGPAPNRGRRPHLPRVRGRRGRRAPAPTAPVDPGDGPVIGGYRPPAWGVGGEGDDDSVYRRYGPDDL